MQAEMSTRSRWERVVAENELSTLPGKRRVLSVVSATRIVPRQAERVHLALRCMGEREAISGRMARVVEIQRLCGIGIDPLGTLSSHINKPRRLYGPLGSAAIEVNRRRFYPKKLSNEARQS